MLRKLSLVVPLISIGCIFPYVYHDQKRVLVRGVDVAASLEIARSELEEGGFDATLALWAIRDQIVTVDQARTICHLYFRHIDGLAAQEEATTAEFGVWHLAWAISNLYRNGDAGIRAVLEDAYRDARSRPSRLKMFKDIASEHVNGKKVYMGDMHAAARAFARSHIVAPGNPKYLQSLEQYRQDKEKKS
jgi:hypothetical protein